MPALIGVQYGSPEEASRCPRGDIRLAFCDTCGFVWNSAFDPRRAEYSGAYDNTLHFSPLFAAYSRDLARTLVERHSLQGRTALEIGCGNGEFLTLLRAQGIARAVGFDPSYVAGPVRPGQAEGIEIVRDHYSDKYRDYAADLVCSRYVFEHIPDPMGLLRTIRGALGRSRAPVVYFEVPNARLVLSDLWVWDVIYEHCSYFTKESLYETFSRAGFRVLRLAESFEGQFVQLEATFGKPSGDASREGDLRSLREVVRRFAAGFQNRTRLWATHLERFARDRTRVAAWGAGARAVTFLNALQDSDAIPVVVDINPRKQGLHLPGTGHPIVPPAFLVDFRPEAVVLMNPVYGPEVRRELEELGLSCRLIVA